MLSESFRRAMDDWLTSVPRQRPLDDRHLPVVFKAVDEARVQVPNGRDCVN